MKKENIFKNFKESLNFIKDSKKFIYFSIGLFFLFAVFGFFVRVPPEISDPLIEYFKELILKTQGFGFFEMFSFLFSNNLGVSVMGLFLGIFVGIFPLFSLLTNGFVLGFVSRLSVGESGILSLFRLLPHGIFELPALFISLGLGLRLGWFVFEKDKKNYLKETFLKSVKTVVFVIIPLLVLAALIESALILFLS